jgi:hypothetical protein
MRLSVELNDIEVEYEVHEFRRGSHTEPDEAVTCDIMGVWITKECGQKLINIQSFLDDDQIEALQDQVLDNLSF